MKRRTGLPLLFLVAATITAALASPAGALPVPQLSGHVNDYARMISPASAQTLEQELSRFEASDSTQIVVLTVPSLQGDGLEDFSIKVAESWRIGHKGVDNGVILIIARDDRKVRIEVGRGLEGRVTDLVAGRIVRNIIIPRFKAGDFDGGVTAGVAGIVEAARGEYKASGREPAAGQRGTPIFTILIFLFVIVLFAGALSKVAGAIVGAIGLPAAAKICFPVLTYPMLGGIALVGIVGALLVHAVFSGGGGKSGGKGRGKGGDAGGGIGGFLTGFLLGGTFFGGGWGGGGRSGGDDFGGFSGGGGDFGGGGASGDW
jgi:uncharacterized protein